jgi:hypothetical protein
MRRLGRDERHYDIGFLTESTEEPEGVRSGDMREQRGARFSYSREWWCKIYKAVPVWGKGSGIGAAGS